MSQLSTPGMPPSTPLAPDEGHRQSARSVPIPPALPKLPKPETNADKFLNSLNLPGTQRAIDQLNQAKEKYQNTDAILKLLQQTFETAKQTLQPGEDRERLLRELELNIQRHQILVERDRLKLSIKENYAQEVLLVNSQLKS